MLRLISVLVGLVVAALVPGEALADPATRAYVGVYLHDVTHFDQRNGTFDVDADVWVKWRGELDVKLLRIHNASADVELEDLGLERDGEWHAQRYHLRGTLRGEFPLHRFPFDEQTLGIRFELPGTRAELVPDLAGSGLARRFSITGWHYDARFRPTVERVVYASDLGTLRNEGLSTKVERVGFGVVMRRPTVTIAVKLFLPLVLLLGIALISLFLAPDLVDARSAIGVTVLLACFAFQFTVAGTIPDVSYLTVVDQLFILAYGLSTATLVVTVAAYWLHRAGRNPAAIRLDRVSRLVLPGLAVIATLAMVGGSEAAPRTQRTSRQPPVAARAPSARPLLRVGVTQLGSPELDLARRATRAALTKRSDSGTILADLAEHAPGVASDQLEVGADGTMSVRFRLRAGLAWSDGHTLTSDDFRFALEVDRDPRIRRIATPDARTLVLTYTVPVGAALEGIAPLPRHVLGSVFRQGGYEAVVRARAERPLPSAGPYRVESFTADRALVLVANPRYHGPAPSIARIEVRAFADAEAIATAFEAGELDYLPAGELSPSVAKDLAGRRADAVVVRASTDLYALEPDVAVPFLVRRLTRAALLRAIDRPALAALVFGEFGAAAETPTRGLSAAPDDALPYDPVAARAELEAQGLVGTRLRITHLARSVDRRIATAVAEALTAVGLVIELRAVRADSPEATARDHGGFRLTLVRGRDADDDPLRAWGLPTVRGRHDGSARSYAYDDATAAVVARFERALYPERRDQLREAIDLEVARRLPILPLCFGTDRLAVDPALRAWDRVADPADWRFRDAPAPAAPTP